MINALPQNFNMLIRDVPPSGDKFCYDAKEGLSNRIVRIVPFSWDNGSGIYISVGNETWKTNAIGEREIVVFHEQVYYDRDYSEISTKLGLISSGDVRGKFLEQTVYNVVLYIFTKNREQYNTLIPEIMEMENL